MTTKTINIKEVLDGHVVLEVNCADRLLMNAYVPKLQVSGQVVTTSASAGPKKPAPHPV